MLQDTQEWLECGKKLVVGDVIRWAEAIWPAPDAACASTDSRT